MSEKKGKDCSQTEFSEAPHGIIAEVTDYWASLRTGSRPPMRNQLEPAALARNLQHVFLAELISPRVARLRICGQQVEDILGMEMRGMPVTAMFSGTARGEVMQAMEQVSLGARVTLVLEGESSFGLPRMTATLALLPLCDETGRISRVMGVLARDGEVGRAPRRFTLAKSVQVSENTRDYEPSARPALRVIDGGKS